MIQSTTCGKNPWLPFILDENPKTKKKVTKKGKTNLVKTTNQHRQEINSELQNLPRLFDVQVYQSKV